MLDKRRPLNRDKRVLRVWLFVMVQVAIFTAVIFTYRELQAEFPDIFDTNEARLLVPAWAGILVIQLVLVILYDFRTVRLRERDRRIRERLERAPEPIESYSNVPIQDQLAEEGYAPITTMRKRDSSDVVWYEPKRDD